MKTTFNKMAMTKISWTTSRNEKEKIKTHRTEFYKQSLKVRLGSQQNFINIIVRNEGNKMAEMIWVNNKV
jgi:hypothetical protein